MTLGPQSWLAPDWPDGGLVRALTTTRAGGVSTGPYKGFNLATHVGDAAEAVAGNRRQLAGLVGSAAIQWLDQVHGSHCFQADGRTAAEVPQADACWTGQRGLALAVLTADCLPVVFARHGAHSFEAPLIGIAHAGWRGLLGGVLETLISSMPCDPAELGVWLGPAIGPLAYQVGRDVRDRVLQLPDGAALAGRVMREQAPGAGSEPGDVRYLLNLFELARELLARRGVTDVLASNACTASDSRFYSYRRDGLTGRMATVVWLAP